MTPAPPPPPPPAPAPTLNVSVNLPNKSALLKSIEKGTKLKKAVTNDRSAPLVAVQTNNAAGNSTESRSSNPGNAGAASVGAAAAGLGGLFANGFPKLRSVGEKGTSSTITDSVKASVATSAIKTAKSSVNESAKKIGDEVKRNLAPAKTPSKPPVAAAAVPPPPLPKKTPKPTASTEDNSHEFSSLQNAMSKTSIRDTERWSFPANVERNLPAPRKFTGCKKVYLSAQDFSSPSASVKGSDEEIGADDIESFIDAMNAKLKSAVTDENFEECVRIKGKLKKLDLLKKKIEKGERVYTSDLP